MLSKINQHLTLFIPSFPIISHITPNKILKTVPNQDRQCIYNKIAYVQSSEFTPALKFHTSSAWHAHDISHVWVTCPGCSNTFQKGQLRNKQDEGPV